MASSRIPFTTQDQIDLASILIDIPQDKRSTPTTHKLVASKFPRHTYSSWHDYYRKSGRDKVDQLLAQLKRERKSKSKLVIQSSNISKEGQPAVQTVVERKVKKMKKSRTLHEDEQAGDRSTEVKRRRKDNQTQNDLERSHPMEEPMVHVSGKGKERERISAMAFSEEDDEKITVALARALINEEENATVYNKLAKDYPYHTFDEWKQRHRSDFIGFAVKIIEAARHLSVTATLDPLRNEVEMKLASSTRVCSDSTISQELLNDSSSAPLGLPPVASSSNPLDQQPTSGPLQLSIDSGEKDANDAEDDGRIEGEIFVRLHLPGAIQPNNQRLVDYPFDHEYLVHELESVEEYHRVLVQMERVEDTLKEDERSKELAIRKQKAKINSTESIDMTSLSGRKSKDSEGAKMGEDVERNRSQQDALESNHDPKLGGLEALNATNIDVVSTTTYPVPAPIARTGKRPRASVESIDRHQRQPRLDACSAPSSSVSSAPPANRLKRSRITKSPPLPAVDSTASTSRPLDKVRVSTTAPHNNARKSDPAAPASIPPAMIPLKQIFIDCCTRFQLTQPQMHSLWFACGPPKYIADLEKVATWFSQSRPQPDTTEYRELKEFVEGRVWSFNEDVIVLSGTESEKTVLKAKKGSQSMNSRARYLHQSGKGTVEKLVQVWPWDI